MYFLLIINNVILLINKKYGRLAQLVEYLVYTESVGGSSPSSPTNRKFLVFQRKHQTMNEA